MSFKNIFCFFAYLTIAIGKTTKLWWLYACA